MPLAKTSLSVRQGVGNWRIPEWSEKVEDVLHLLPQVLRGDLVGDGTHPYIDVLRGMDYFVTLLAWHLYNVNIGCTITYLNCCSNSYQRLLQLRDPIVVAPLGCQMLLESETFPN